MPLVDIFGSDLFSTTSLIAALRDIKYRPQRLGQLGLFDEKPINTTSVIIEQRGESLALIQTTPRGAPGDFLETGKRKAHAFVANHLRRNAKIFADEVQGVRVFGSESETETIEQKRTEKLTILQAQHEATWEWHRMGALTGKLLDADGTTVLLDMHDAFGVTQTPINFQFTNANLDVRAVAESVSDAIDDELGASTYERVHVFAGGAFYDALLAHPKVSKILEALRDPRMLEDMRRGFTIGGLTFERARRWRVKNHLGVMVDMINTNDAYAFPIGAQGLDGPIFIGRFAPQPFLDTVNRLNPPLVVKTIMDPGEQFIDLVGISCPLYLNTRPGAVIKLTKS